MTRAIGFALLLLVAVASALAVVYARHRHRVAFVEATRLERERDELNIEFGRLQLELATWAETGRIERMARDELGMRFPEGADVVVVQP